MITDELLERGLAGAADEYDVPVEALARLRGELAPQPAPRRMRVHVPHPHGGKRWLAVGAAAAVALVGIAIGVGGSGPSGQSHNAAQPGRVYAGLPPVPSNAVQDQKALASVAAPTIPTETRVVPQSAGAGTAAGNGASAPDLSTPPDRITKLVRTGEMDLQASKGQVQSIVNRVTGIATLEGGFVADQQVSGGSDPSAYVTLRMPSTAFFATVQQVNALGVKVLSQQTKSTDVTSSYVDLQARIHALQTARSTYLRILSQTSSIGDILAVQSRIDDLQTQIEQWQGQLNVLANQTAYGTLTVTVDQKATPAAAVHHQSGMSRAFHRSVNRFVHGVESIVGVIGPVLLAVLLIALAWIAARLGYRVLRRRVV